MKILVIGSWNKMQICSIQDTKLMPEPDHSYDFLSRGEMKVFALGNLGTLLAELTQRARNSGRW